jgi:ABC-2 type transport system permease protein
VTGLIRTELFKIRTTRTGWGMLALTLAFVACPPLFIIPLAGAEGENGLPPLSDPDMVRTVYGSATSGTTFAFVLGILGMTGEYRYRTLTQAFLETPRRSRVIVAKIVAYSMTGASFGIAAALLITAVVLPAMALKDGPVSLLVHDVPTILGGAVLASTLFALIGLGVGALIHNQVAAIALAVGWLWLTEVVIITTIPAVGTWLPGGALQALVAGNAGLTVTEVPDLLPVWGGAAVLLGYGVAFATAGTAVTMRRDIS